MGDLYGAASRQIHTGRGDVRAVSGTGLVHTERDSVRAKRPATH